MRVAAAELSRVQRTDQVLTDRDWKLKYTPEGGDLVDEFYVPALEDAARYDRLTGYFNAGALALAARGVEGLIRNDGRMRLIVGCTLDTAEIEAIERGEELREQVRQKLMQLPLAPPDASANEALELLAWMIGQGHLEVKVAVPCNKKRRPVSDTAIFHEKSGIIEDRTGHKIAWTGSLNETAAGWKHNWESINVYRSWGPEPERVASEERNFARLWADQSARAIVLNVPDAARQDLLRFMPKTELPARLKATTPPVRKPLETTEPTGVVERAPVPASGRRQLVWTFIQRAPADAPGGAQVGEATAAITPWPHQIRAFERLYTQWPPRLLIADEVGLGKTIQAGLLLRQAWLAGRAKRILILAPKAVLNQWQIELREKFNLNWPIYDGRTLQRHESQALRGNHERVVDRDHWHEEPVVIASSHLMRRKDRAGTLIENAEPWDLVVLDEAHHARRHAAGSQLEGGPNSLLKLMRALKARTQGLVLLTATPMQVHPIEVWDLLDLLGLPPEWTAAAFLQFFKEVNQPNPSAEALDRMAGLFQAVERKHGAVSRNAVENLTKLSSFKVKKVLRALRSTASIPRRQLETPERRAAIAIMRTHTPIRRLVSRHTRELLRRYASARMLSTPIAKRHVEDRFIEMSDDERDLYKAVEEYISKTYNQAASTERSAIGFVMTVYRRRLASSFAALRATFERRRDRMMHGSVTSPDIVEEDTPDDEVLDEIPDTDELAAMAMRAAGLEEQNEIEKLLERVLQLPADSKLGRLTETLDELQEGGYRQVMVFTQFTDTMDFLRSALTRRGGVRLMCFSGRGGEIPDAGEDGKWHRIDREQVKHRFREGNADVLLCTDAAAEGLNFQFCGALVNYDMPWNPMRVEQRIGRIDRVGQQNATIQVVNLHYEGTVETAVYRRLRERIGLFEQVVGRLQPILAQMPRAITGAVLSRHGRGDAENVADQVERQATEEGQVGFDIDATLDSDLAVPTRTPSPITLDDLDRVINDAGLMPPGTEVQAMGRREYSLLAPGMSSPVRVTTERTYYEENSESVELWSPGNPLFNGPAGLTETEDVSIETTLKDVLDK